MSQAGRSCCKACSLACSLACSAAGSVVLEPPPLPPERSADSGTLRLPLLPLLPRAVLGSLPLALGGPAAKGLNGAPLAGCRVGRRGGDSGKDCCERAEHTLHRSVHAAPLALLPCMHAHPLEAACPQRSRRSSSGHPPGNGCWMACQRGQSAARRPTNSTFRACCHTCCPRQLTRSTVQQAARAAAAAAPPKPRPPAQLARVAKNGVRRGTVDLCKRH